MKKTLFIFVGLLLTVSVFSQSSYPTNTAMGFDALLNVTTGKFNSAFGLGALVDNNTRSFNTAVGAFALNSNMTGDYNTAIGSNALLNIPGGNYLTVLGYKATVNANNLTNTTVIGNGALGTANNQVTIGNSSVTSIRGYASWTNISDGRIKKNIRLNVPGLDFIMKLQPVTYNVNLDVADKILMTDMPESKLKEYDFETLPVDKKAREVKEKRVYTGFIAQDVEKAAKSIGYDFSGVDATDSDNSLYGLRYSEFVVPLVKAVQELSEQNVSLKEQVEKLTEQVNSLLNLKESKSLSEIRSLPVSDASLEQNYPNPFNSSTTINYTLPTTFRSAKIVITTLSGQIFRQIPISNTGAGSIMIEAGALSAGIYYYSLYVDEMLVDTKKMIVK